MKINARGLHTVGLRIVLLAAVAHTMWGDGQGGKNRLEKKKKREEYKQAHTGNTRRITLSRHPWASKEDCKKKKEILFHLSKA